MVAEPISGGKNKRTSRGHPRSTPATTVDILDGTSPGMDSKSAMTNSKAQSVAPKVGKRPRPDSQERSDRSTPPQSPADIFLAAAAVRAAQDKMDDVTSKQTRSSSSGRPGTRRAKAEAAKEQASLVVDSNDDSAPSSDRRKADDLNAKICDAMGTTGTLTSQQLFDLAKPYYDLNPSKSELAQWARARIANLRRKRKVWPTAHMVYGTIKPEGYSRNASTDRHGMWEFKGLRKSIDASNFLEAPRTVYWSWNHGLAKHNLTIEVAGGGNNPGSAADAETPTDKKSPSKLQSQSQEASSLSNGTQQLEQKILFKFDQDANSEDAVAAVAKGRIESERFQALADISSAEVISPTQDLRDALLLTRISSPVNTRRANVPGSSPGPESAPPPSSMKQQKSPAGATKKKQQRRQAKRRSAFESSDGGMETESPLTSPDTNNDSSNRLLMLAMIAKEIQSDRDEPERPKLLKKPRTAIPKSEIFSFDIDESFDADGRKGPKGPHRGAKYRCGRCGFYPKSCPHDCSTGQPRPGAEHMAAKFEASLDDQKSPSDTPRYQARPKQYACGKCGFFPKSVMHDCETGERTNTPVKPVRRHHDTPKWRAPRRDSNTSSPGRPRQYRCGRCGFFPKSTRHDCSTGEALSGAEIIRSDTEEFEAQTGMANRRKKYKCGKCNFFPKAQPHDCSLYQNSSNLPSPNTSEAPGSVSNSPDPANRRQPSSQTPPKGDQPEFATPVATTRKHFDAAFHTPDPEHTELEGPPPLFNMAR